MAELERRQRTVDDAVAARDTAARQALADGMGIRGLAMALGIDKTTAQRRYGKRGAA